MDAQPIAIIKQRPYDRASPISLLTNNGRIFCPYYHDVTYPSTSDERYQHYVANNYPSATVPYIERYHDAFMSLHMGDIIIVPHRSYNTRGNKNLGYLLRIDSEPRWETIDGFSALFTKIEIMNDSYPVKSGVRQSFVWLDPHRASPH